MAFEPGGETYEDEPYAELTYQETHPGGLAAIGLLLGLEPAAVETCRVLELGCASGANLLAMAETLPAAEFVGVDVSGRQVAEGRVAAQALGFANVDLRQGDILDLPTDMGTFDYVIAHGVYSWVPAEVRDALLAACRSLLNPHGIAYVSYNAYPGWAPMKALREMLFYRTRDSLGQHQRAEDAETFYRLLQKANPAEGSSFGHFLGEYESHVEGRHRIAGERAASLLLHDEMADVNDPVYFHEFAGHAARHGLQYMADADFPTVFATRLPAEAQAELRRLAATAIEHQQYLDFLTNATFKRTLLCHEERAVSRRIGERIEPFRSLFAASPARPAAAEAKGGARTFAGSDGARFTTANPIGQAALAILCERYPERVAFPALAEAACERVGAEAPALEAAEAQLAAVLLQGFCYSASLVELRTTAGAYTVTPGERPTTPAFARRQVAGDSLTVTNLRHERVTVDTLQARLIALFDGTRTRDAVFREVDEGSNRFAKRFERALETLTEMAFFRA